MTKGRGSTGVARPAITPAGIYEPSPPVRHTPTELAVDVHGEDGRDLVLRIDQLPLTGWHELLASALAHRTGPAGGRRTRTSVKGVWKELSRFLRFLDGLSEPPQEPRALAAAHLESYRRFRLATTNEHYAWWQGVREVGRLLEQEPLRSAVSGEVLDYLARRVDYAGPRSKPGYSDNELT